jgi:hypothetical protein
MKKKEEECMKKKEEEGMKHAGREGSIAAPKAPEARNSRKHTLLQLEQHKAEEVWRQWRCKAVHWLET